MKFLRNHRASFFTALAVVTAASWIRSHIVQDVVGAGDSVSGAVGCAVSRGQILICLNRGVKSAPDTIHRRLPVYHRAFPATSFNVEKLPDYWHRPLSTRPRGDILYTDLVNLHPIRASSDATIFERMGFGVRTAGLSRKSGGPSTLILIPFWTPFAVLVFLAIGFPGNRRRLLRHRGRVRGGQCSNCAYDLRATPGSCPECGSGAAAHDAGTAVPPPR